MLMPPAAPFASNACSAASPAASAPRTSATSSPTSRVRDTSVFRTRWQRLPKSREQAVSSACAGSSDTVTTSAVRHAPPRLCFSSSVSVESRNGTNAPRPFPSASITRASADSDVLMLRASTPARPVLPDLCSLSDPARSTNRNLDETRRRPRCCVTESLTTQWLRLLRSLSAWLLADRVASIMRDSRAMSTADRTGTSFWPDAS
mmetsp:Transcript_4233/g.15613  ORF Transcript_4233/g.15613 Transcript_4233/m.15613 type:complete len:205 (-) Transcript_4233:918-1532(-)